MKVIRTLTEHGARRPANHNKPTYGIM